MYPRWNIAPDKRKEVTEMAKNATQFATLSKQDHVNEEVVALKSRLEEVMTSNDPGPDKALKHALNTFIVTYKSVDWDMPTDRRLDLAHHVALQALPTGILRRYFTMNVKNLCYQLLKTPPVTARVTRPSPAMMPKKRPAMMAG